jgi:hypothetical protein
VDERQAALAKHLSVDVDEVTGEGDEWYCSRQTWRVLSDAAAESAAREAIRDSVWAFNASFIADHTRPRLNGSAVKALEEMQAKLCESAQTLIEALIHDMDEFVRDAISADGRGHFLAGYDNEENEQDGWFLYRVG